MKTKILHLLFVIFFANLTASAQQQVTCGIFTFDVIITPVTCNGDCDGAIQISNISGGTPPYTTFWSTGSTVPSIFNLCEGDYTIFISDNLGDTCSMTFTVSQPSPLQVTETVTNATCATCCDGAIVLTPIGGVAPYNYVFTPSNPPGNLCPDTYNWCVTNMIGCSTCDTVVVSFPTAIKNNANATTFSIYPNPTNGIVYLSTTQQFVEVYSILGKKIVDKYTNEVNLTDFNSGVYYLVIKDKKGNWLHKEKLIKQ